MAKYDGKISSIFPSSKPQKTALFPSQFASISSKGDQNYENQDPVCVVRPNSGVACADEPLRKWCSPSQAPARPPLYKCRRYARSPPSTRRPSPSGSNGAMRRRELQLQPAPSRYLFSPRRSRPLAQVVPCFSLIHSAGSRPLAKHNPLRSVL